MDMALRRKVIDFVRLGFLHDPNEVRCIRHIAIVQPKPHIAFMRVLVKVINPPGIERGRPPFDPMNHIAF